MFIVGHTLAWHNQTPDRVFQDDKRNPVRVADGDSWLNNWPMKGRTNYPLLFDRFGKAKPAFDAVIAARDATNDLK